MNKKIIKVSVIMGFYNNQSTLARAIDSILMQSYDAWELIMCDDGSTDASYLIAKEYFNKYPEKIILIQNSENMHLANALNKCLDVATGEYIARMDADDESLPMRFERQVEYLNGHPDMILCGTSCVLFDEITHNEHVINCIEIPNKYTIYRRTPFNHATIMCRKQMYAELGGYSEKSISVRCEDKDLWYRFFAQGYKGGNLREPLYKVYENEDSIYRRTPKSRWNILLTNLNGYHLLGYPWYWYFRPFINLFKVFVPRKLIVFFRKTNH